MKNVETTKMQIMKVLKILFVITLTIITSCSNNKKNKNNITKNVEISTDNGKGTYKLIQKRCYACHSVTSKSHHEIIAPPMVAVKGRYKMSFPTEKEFVSAITNWVLDPTEENALMYGAVQNFKIMPKQSFKKEEIIKIAIYIFNNELEKPSWFQKYCNEEHPNGKRRGMFKNN